MTTPLAWILVPTIVVFVGVLVYLLLKRSRPEEAALPQEWSLTARPVFSAQEQRMNRQLREALPQQVILAKLPLVRFCHPNDPTRVRYWFELLGAIHVGYAICSQNGRVLAAIDLDDGRGAARRSVQIKQAVLAACHIRYVRYSTDQTPSVPELQLLVPAAVQSTPPPLPGAVMHASFGRATAIAGRQPPARTAGAANWLDSGFLKDSAFGRDSVISGFHSTMASTLPERAGEVVDSPALRH